MHQIRNSYGRASRVICFLFAVHLFNFSIDPKDRQPNFVPEDLTINEIESVMEFFAEVLFSFENAFEEHDEADDENGSSIDFCKIFIVSQGSPYLILGGIKTISAKYFIKNAGSFALLSREINSFPPKS